MLCVGVRACAVRLCIRYDPEATRPAEDKGVLGSVIGKHKEIDVAEMLEGMKQMMTSQVKRKVFNSIKLVRCPGVQGRQCAAPHARHRAPVTLPPSAWPHVVPTPAPYPRCPVASYA